MTVRTDGPDRAAVRSAVTGREATCCNCYVSGHCCAPDHPPCPVAPGRASGTTRGAVMPDAGRTPSSAPTPSDERVLSCIHTNCGRAADSEVAGRACCMACAMAWGTRTAPVHIRRCDLREAGRWLCSCGHGEERHDDMYAAAALEGPRTCREVGCLCRTFVEYVARGDQ